MGEEEVAGGLRERKKALRRLALHHAAVELFDADGYDATTVAKISAKAGVSPRTFFSYYATKEAALFGPLDDAIDAIEQDLAVPYPDRDVLDLFRIVMTKLVAQGSPLDEQSTKVLQGLAATHANIVGYALHCQDRLSKALSKALRAELGSEEGDLLPEIAASAAITALAAARPMGTDASCTTEMSDLEVVERDMARAIEFIRAGIAGTTPVRTGT